MHSTVVELLGKLDASFEQPCLTQIAQRHANRVDKIVMLTLGERRGLIDDQVGPGFIRGVNQTISK